MQSATDSKGPQPRPHPRDLARAGGYRGCQPQPARQAGENEPLPRRKPPGGQSRQHSPILASSHVHRRQGALAAPRELGPARCSQGPTSLLQVACLASRPRSSMSLDISPPVGSTCGQCAQRLEYQRPLAPATGCSRVWCKNASGGGTLVYRRHSIGQADMQVRDGRAGLCTITAAACMHGSAVGTLSLIHI